jgi:hypothetical protein
VPAVFLHWFIYRGVCGILMVDASLKYHLIFADIGRLYAAGMTQHELAQHYGISQAQVSRIMNTLHVETRVPKNLKQAGADNANWKGNTAGYAALHIRVEKERGKPQECEVCGTTAASRYEWANMSGKYDDINDYKRLCKSCHAKHDGIINNIRKEAMR